MKPSIRKKLTIPIYDIQLWIILSQDIYKERSKFDHIFGPSPTPDYGSLCSCDSGIFGLFFHPDQLSFGRVAHELFHLTHRILEWGDSNFDMEHQEEGARLNEYLTELVLSELKSYRFTAK